MVAAGQEGQDQKAARAECKRLLDAIDEARPECARLGVSAAQHILSTRSALLLVFACALGCGEMKNQSSWACLELPGG